MTGLRQVKGYNFLAPVYDPLLSLLARTVKRSQNDLIDKIPDGINILLLGEGSGNFLKALLVKKPECKITCLDISPRMLNSSRKKNGNLNDIHYICADVLDYTYTDKYQMIVTNFFLDLFKEGTIKEIIKKYSSMLTPDGLWYFTDFTPASGIFYNLYLTALYVFFRTVCRIEARNLPVIELIFHELHFKPVYKKKFRHHIYSIIFQKEPGQTYIIQENFSN